MSCKNCGGSNIEEGVIIGQNLEAAPVGPKYKWGLMTTIAPLFCDICRDCGEITRLYITENTDQKWVKY